MASGFLGVFVVVTLHNGMVQGTVAAVNPQTLTLTLENVFFPATGHRLLSLVVEGHAIVDIKIGANPPASPYTLEPHANGSSYSYPPSHSQRGSINNEHKAPLVSSQQPTQQPAPQPQAMPFVDPAILSMGKKKTVALLGQGRPGPPQEAPATPIEPLSAVSTSSHKTALPFPKQAKDVTSRKPSAATVEGPFSSLNIADAEEADSETKARRPSVRRTSINKTRTGKPMDDPTPQKHDDNKRNRRGGKSRKKELASQEERNRGDLHSSPDIPKKKGNGWRNTPILQDAVKPQPQTPGIIVGRIGIAAARASNRRTRKQLALEATNGWATEDATDIQDMPDFDFQSNLSKFDKRTVFDQIRNEDTTADEDRLVSFNRIARPGTYGGKNLHPTENVLDRKWKSTTNTSSEELSDFGSGRNSRRTMSRTSLKRAPVRQGSVVQPDVDVMTSRIAAQGNRSLMNRQYTSSHATGSPKLGRIASPPESPTESNLRGCLRLTSNNRRCHAITPGAMLTIEEVAEAEFSFNEDLIAENAGRGIAKVALTAINPGGRRMARENPNPHPVIVVLAGNHRGGARAIAAARHLLQRGLKIMVALLGFERAADWDKDIRRQVDLFRNFGGSVRAWQETEDVLKRLHAPPELIIDALLGRNKEFEALGDEDRRVVLAIVGWANKSHAACLAVEIPSGVAGSTGEVSILEGEPLEVRAKYIVCLGAPRTGLLKALQRGAGRDPAWLIWLVDIGVNQPWRDAGIGGGKGIRFGEHWVVQARFVGGEHGVV